MATGCGKQNYLAVYDRIQSTRRKLNCAIASTYHWFGQIAKGEVTSIREIAVEERMDEGDVSRFLPFAFLAPDILEAIISGKQPLGLTAETLKQLRQLPYSWEGQHQLMAETCQ